MHTLHKKLVRGFTLIELTIVGFILATIAMIVAPSIIGSTNGVKATQIIRIADQAAINWLFLCSQTGSATSVGPTPYTQLNSDYRGLGANGVIFLGKNYVSGFILGAYVRLNIQPLSDVVGFDPSSKIFSVIGIPGSTVSMTGGGTSPIAVNFGNIPYDIFHAIYLRSNPTGTPVLGSTATVGGLSYNCPSNTGTCALTFTKPQ